MSPYRNILVAFTVPAAILLAGCATAVTPAPSAPTAIPAATAAPTATSVSISTPVPPATLAPAATAVPTNTPVPIATSIPASTPLPAATPLPTSALVLPGTVQVRLEVAEGTTARYMVREQLANLSLPNDAVGTTRAVTGSISLRKDNAVLAEESKFNVDLTNLQTNDSRRDNYVRRNTLETSRFPNAEFVAREIKGLTAPLPVQGKAQFQLTGDLTLHGVASPVTWDVAGDFTQQGFTGKATTAFPFSQFGLKIPSVFLVVSVEDNIRLELDLNLVRKS
ncbi:MAG: YceI family protein [SAR202 cluster bacterium]|nr:YceI family protein [SAR202 cluster bacterium]